MPEYPATAIVSFGAWVQQRRETLDFTRPALARRVGCSSATIKKIERDERRPSRQIATLLADQLLIPAQERDRFIQMARGEFVATPLTSPDIVSLPLFLWPSPETCQPHTPPLVAREEEMAQLMARLEAALAGRGNIVFITGEAGDGKTMLAQSFIRQSQEKMTELVVATGNCNAYTGIGDPYLPFREILELLTGDIEARWVAGALNRSYAERLWRIVPHAIEALITVAPDLVGTFLSGPPLSTRATAAAPTQTGERIAQLQDLVRRHAAQQPASHLQQSNLLAQYMRLLQTVARRHPLLLVIDDLQWADTASLSLLFYLSRHLQGQRIMVIGIYRGAEVALGRAGERHPLEPILNELQQTHGDIHIRLNQTDSRRFVDALIDSEPNRLGRSFRDALYRQTGGHPLFTAELLHALQARGDLVQNEDGEWIESPMLAWEIVPARVEGLIKERIGRLPPPLQELLQVASVAGETFCAEVIAHVQGRNEWEIATQLGTILARQQRLVIGQGSQQIGTTRLSHYRFRHILFQQYLYNSLDQIQRSYLHRVIAAALEQRLGGQAATIAPQLARHYFIAGDKVHALHYFTIAGDQAAAGYANTEAAAHYRQALALATEAQSASAPPLSTAQLSRLYARLGRTLELDAHYDRALATYEAMAQTAAALGDDAMRLTSLLARATIRTTVNFARDPAEGQRLLEEAHTLARDLEDRSAEAKILWNLLILSAYTGGDLAQRLRYGEEALALIRELDWLEQLAFTLHDIFYAYAGAGQWLRAREALYEARDLWQNLGNLPMLSATLMRLHWTYLVTGEYGQAIAHAEEAYRLGQESNNLDAQALSHFMLGFVHWERGQIDQALAIMEEDIAIAETVHSLTPLIGTRADLGLLYGEVGDLEHGLALAEQARTTAETQLPILRFWPHAIQISLHLRKGDLAAAADLMATLADYRTVKARFGYMPFMWVRVGLAQGEFALAQGEYNQAATLMDALHSDLCEAGIWYLRPDVLHLKGRALLGLGNIDDAREVLEDARSIAEGLGSQRALWPILVSLAEVAHQRDAPLAAETLRQAAQDIVAAISQQMDSPQRDLILALPQLKALLLPDQE